MKCKICGGALLYSNGTYVCESCHNQFLIADFYENIDTFICYVENDEYGRRTKDSIIAQDIYQKLESNKIRTFYSRISADTLVGEELEQACNVALHMAKTILVLGTQRQYFDRLIEKYSAYFGDKVIIPIYTDMDAYAIPKNISAIQALDYNKVGATVDLTKGLLNALGRSEEIDFVKMSDKSNAKKKSRVWIVISILLFAVAGTVFGYFVHQFYNQETELSPEEIMLQQYDEAISCVEEDDYIGAIELFSVLGDFRDSEKQLLLLYEKYAGYYRDEEKNTTFRLQIWEGCTAGVEMSKMVENGAQVQISTTSQFKKNVLTLEFVDSENNNGQIVVELKRDQIKVQVEVLKNVSDVTFDNAQYTFLLESKSDKPFGSTLDAETLFGFINNKITMKELRQKGYEVEYESNLYAEGLASAEYRIKNTNVLVGIVTYEASLDAEGYIVCTKEIPLDDCVIFSISAPASIVAPDRVGKTNGVFVENDILFVPDGELMHFSYAPILVEQYGATSVERKSEVVLNETNVCCISKEAVGDQLFDELVFNFMVIGRVESLYCDTYDLEWARVGVEEHEDYYLVHVHSSYTLNGIDHVGPNITYQVNKKTYEIQMITQ